MEPNEVVYTTAGAEYDYWYVTVESDNVGTTTNGKVIRKVRIPHSRVPYQCGRYLSGLHLAIDQVAFDKQVAYKFINVEAQS